MSEILIGLVSGIVSGTGMGGGTILIFLLSFLIGIEQHIAQATNLIFFIPTSIFGILGAIIGANISIHIDVGILKKCFGVFLATIAIHEIYSIFKIYIKQYKSNKKKRK